MTVATGVFGAHMQVALLNDGPVTIMLDSDFLHLMNTDQRAQILQHLAQAIARRRLTRLRA